MSDLPALRASDADRERTAELLREHSGEGRLTYEELAERLGRAFAAQTLSELRELTSDLPEAARRPPARRKPTRWMVTAVGEAAKRGRFRIRDRMVVLLGLGECEVDLREAELDGDEATVWILQWVGETKVIVPPHVDVDLGGVVFLGTKHETGMPPPRDPDAPLLRVRAVASLGEIKVVRKPL